MAFCLHYVSLLLYLPEDGSVDVGRDEASGGRSIDKLAVADVEAYDGLLADTPNDAAPIE